MLGLSSWTSVAIRTEAPGSAPLSDREVLRDYKSILAPGAVIAGPAALDLKSGVLPDEAVHWLKTNFFKTELELGPLPAPARRGAV